MALTPKQRASITQNLLQIKNDTFDESHIKNLLIDIRELAPQNSLIRELGHFIAHQVRNSGKYYNLLALRAATLNFILKVDPNNPDGVIIDIDFNKIHYKIWDVVFIAGSDNFDRSFKLVPFYVPEFMKKANVVNFLKHAYKKKGSYYELVDAKFYPQVFNIAKEYLRYFDGNPLFLFDEFVDIINDEVKGLCNRNASSINFGNSIKRNGSNVTLCIMSLLQNVNFELFNGEKGGFKLTLHGAKYVTANFEEFISNKSTLMIAGGVYVNNKLQTAFSYITSPLNPKEIINGLSDEEIFAELPPVYTYRDENNMLRLKAY